MKKVNNSGSTETEPLKKTDELKKVLRFSKKIVLIMFIGAGIFTVVMIITYFIIGSVPDTLITEFFGFFKLEGGALGIIKVSETAIEIINNLFTRRKTGNVNQLEAEANVEKTLGGTDSNNNDGGRGDF